MENEKINDNIQWISKALMVIAMCMSFTYCTVKCMEKDTELAKLRLQGENK